MDGLEALEASARAWAGLPDQEGGFAPFQPGQKVRRRQYAGPDHVGTVLAATDESVTVYSKIRGEGPARWVEAVYIAPASELVACNDAL